MASRGGGGGGEAPMGARIMSAIRGLSQGSVSSANEAREIVEGGGSRAMLWLRSGGGTALANALKDRRVCRRRELLPPLLSAIADCCLHPDSRQLIGELKLSSELVYILKHATEDQLVGKTCRVIGNLAQDLDNAELLHREDVVGALQNIIDSDKIVISTPTLMLAVRAIRFLWMVSSRQEEMVKKETIKSVATRLCTECEKSDVGNTKKNSPKKSLCRKKTDLFSGLLKCIGYFSKHPTSSCVQQILGDGRGYKCLVDLSKEFESLALQIILNLSYVEECRPLLGSAGVVERLIDALNSKADRSSSWIKILNLLCRSHVNRLIFENNNGFPILIALVKDVSNLTCHLYALQTFLNFLLSHEVFLVLAEEGAIEVFVDLLKYYMVDLEFNHKSLVVQKGKERICKKRKKNTSLETIDEDWDSASNTCSSDNKYKCDEESKKTNQERKFNSYKSIKKASPAVSPLSDYSSANTAILSPDYSSKTHKYFSAGSISGFSPGSPGSSLDSPTSYWNDLEWSPASSSISQYDEESVDSEWSAHYSPVCSDNEDTVTCVPAKIQQPSESNEMVDAINELLEDDNITSEQLRESSIVEKTHIHKIRGLMHLIYMFCFCPVKISVKLASVELLYMLVDYIQKCKYPMRNMAVKLFNAIISEKTNLRHLLKHSIVLHMYDIIQNPKHKKCRQCRQVNKILGKFTNEIASIAESDYGVGEICHLLLKGDQTIKETLAITLPFIIRSIRILRKFYFNCEALELFLTILSSEKRSLDHCVPALAKLATTFTIPAPKPVFAEFKDFILLDYEPGVIDSDNEVLFVLDDSSVVRANIELLCGYSDVFNTMLHGQFAEANQKYVKLQKVSKDGLEYLFGLLEVGVHEKTVEIFPLPKSLDIALETLLLTDRFLMDKVKNLLFSAIVQFKLDSTNADKIYKWSLEEGMGMLCMESVAYTLVGKMDDSKRCNIILTILNSIYKEQWIDDVRNNLLRFMVY